MSQLPHPPDKVKLELQQALPGLLERLGFKWPGALPKIWQGPNPRGLGKSRKGFTIWTSGEGAGCWKDYEGGGVDRGDVYGLIQYVEKLDRWLDAYWWALAFLNLPVNVERTPQQAAQEKIERQDRETERRIKKLQAEADEAAEAGRLYYAWTKLPPITGTVAEAYLRGRGIKFERLGSPKFRLGALRYAHRLEHIDDRTGEVTYWPAMVAVMVKGSRAKGLHRTWLRPDGRGKAEVATPKKMIGRVSGAAIRLTNGASGLPLKAAIERGVAETLAIGEGIETSLSVAAAKPAWRVWAAGSLSLMGLIDWPACASQVVLLRDNDWQNEAAQRGFERVVEHWRRQAKARRVHVATSELGKDFNDWAGAA